jgi:hypothetical protein
MASLERRVAIDAARAAGQLLRSELAGARRIAYKGAPTNLVTEMDARVGADRLDASSRIRRVRYSCYATICVEYSSTRTTAQRGNGPT